MPLGVVSFAFPCFSASPSRPQQEGAVTIQAAEGAWEFLAREDEGRRPWCPGGPQAAAPGPPGEPARPVQQEGLHWEAERLHVSHAQLQGKAGSRNGFGVCFLT